MLGYVQDGTVDTLAFGTFVATEFRKKHFDFSYPTINKLDLYYVHRPTLSVQKAALLIFSVFEANFYFLSFALLVVLYLLSKQRGGSFKNTLVALLHFCIPGKVKKKKPKKNDWNVKIASCLLGYFMLLIMGLYQGRLLTQLLIANKEEPFRSLEELTAEMGSENMAFVVETVNSAEFAGINTSLSYEFR